MWILVKIVKVGQNCESWSKLWFLVKIVNFGRNCEFWSKLWILLKMWNLVKIDINIIMTTDCTDCSKTNWSYWNGLDLYVGWTGRDGTGISDRPTTIAPLKAVLIMYCHHYEHYNHLTVITKRIMITRTWLPWFPMRWITRQVKMENDSNTFN